MCQYVEGNSNVLVGDWKTYFGTVEWGFECQGDKIICEYPSNLWITYPIHDNIIYPFNRHIQYPRYTCTYIIYHISYPSSLLLISHYSCREIMMYIYIYMHISYIIHHISYICMINNVDISIIYIYSCLPYIANEYPQPQCQRCGCFCPSAAKKDRSRLLPGDASGGGIEQPPETKENALRISWGPKKLSFLRKSQVVITGFIRESVFWDIYGYSYWI